MMQSIISACSCRERWRTLKAFGVVSISITRIAVLTVVLSTIWGGSDALRAWAYLFMGASTIRSRSTMADSAPVGHR
jgi:hypothetical protein